MKKGSPLKADPFFLEAASGFEPLNRGFADLIDKFSECFLTSFHSHLITFQRVPPVANDPLSDSEFT